MDELLLVTLSLCSYPRFLILRFPIHDLEMEHCIVRKGSAVQGICYHSQERKFIIFFRNAKACSSLLSIPKETQNAMSFASKDVDDPQNPTF